VVCSELVPILDHAVHRVIVYLGIAKREFASKWDVNVVAKTVLFVKTYHRLDLVIEGDHSFFSVEIVRV